MVDFSKARMLRSKTPLEDYRYDCGLFVKREDLSCPPPGPPFSKARGVYAHILKREEKVIGVLDTAHSQAGHAVARACQILGKTCYNFYPVYKHEWKDDDAKTHVIREAQGRAKMLGAKLIGLPAGRSCILFHAAKKKTAALKGYMMPNALKLIESVEETAKEVANCLIAPDVVIIPVSSGTIAAGVIQGFHRLAPAAVRPKFILHLGYSRSHEEVVSYVKHMSGVPTAKIQIVDEKYAYKDVASDGPTPKWPCNQYYDLKAYRWYMENRELFENKKVLFWNIG